MGSESPAGGVHRVLSEDGVADPAADPRAPLSTVSAMYRELRRVRLLDARMAALQRQGRIGFYGSCLGQEAVPIGAAFALDPADWVFPALRESCIMLARGFPLARYLAQVFGSAEDVARGRQMPSHQSARAVSVVSWSSTVGSQLPQAVGAAWAQKRLRDGRITVAFLGDGATSTGDFHAAMNLAGVFRVPCVFVCQNNHFAISTPGSVQTASTTFAAKGAAYGVPAVRVDGNDALAVYGSVRDARARALAGGGPSFIECVTYRMGPHSSSDDPSAYRSDDDVRAWAKRDPILRLSAHLRRLGALSDAADARLDAELAAEMDAAIAAAEAEPGPPRASLFEDVYARPTWNLVEQAREG